MCVPVLQADPSDSLDESSSTAHIGAARQARRRKRVKRQRQKQGRKRRSTASKHYTGLADREEKGREGLDAAGKRVADAELGTVTANLDKTVLASAWQQQKQVDEDVRTTALAALKDKQLQLTTKDGSTHPAVMSQDASETKTTSGSSQTADGSSNKVVILAPAVNSARQLTPADLLNPGKPQPGCASGLLSSPLPLLINDADRVYKVVYVLVDASASFCHVHCSVPLFTAVS